jgi:prepilin-type N-terminal cleavage/methylation domain-containing protein
MAVTVVRRMGDLRRGDDGFTLVETIVALVVFALISTATTSVLLRSTIASRSSVGRTAAATLATRELEIVRDRFNSPSFGPSTVQTGQVIDPDPLPGGTAGQPLSTNGMTFTVTRVAEWESSGASAGACDGGASSTLAFLRVTVTVTWATMGSTAPVTSSTLLTPTPGTFGAGTGSVAVKVTGPSAQAESGVTVTLASGANTTSQVTAADGCAYFAWLSPGQYTLTAGAVGYVDATNNASPSQTVSVTANTVQTVALSYAPAATLQVSPAIPATGFTPPTVMPVTLYNSAFPTSTQTLALTASTSPQSASLWPWPSGVSVWSGTCADADPSTYSGGSRALPVALTSGGTTSTSSITKALTVTVTSHSSGALSGATVVAIHAADTGCPGPVTNPAGGASVGQALTLPTSTSTAGTTATGLPYGKWTLEVVGKSAYGSWPTITLTPTAASPQSATVTVS